MFSVLDPKLQADLARYRRVMDSNLPKINAALKAAGQTEIVPSTAEPPAKVTANDISDDSP